MVGDPTDTQDSGNVNYPNMTLGNGPLEGQTSETPQIQGKISYAGNLWGTAGFYGAPKPFTAQVAFGWQRSRYRATAFAGPDQVNQQYLNNWCVQGTLFIPIIPTSTKNLAGTAALTVQAYMGQGLAFIGNNTGFNSYAVWVESFDGDYRERKLVKNWGGYVQANYYFTNQWFMNVAAGLGCNYGLDGWAAQQDGAVGNQVHQWWEADINLYYRPITAFKFGLGYAYTRADYYRNAAVQSNVTNVGDGHRMQFAGWFFF
jgi:hypothetical protein